MNKKYKLTDETIEYKGKTLYRIEALRDINIVVRGGPDYLTQEMKGNSTFFQNYGICNVPIGTKGGFIESEQNLSHEGSCWIYNNAKVYDEAEVSGDAIIGSDYCRVEIFDNAKVFDRANILGNAKVYGNAKVHGDAIIIDYAKIYGNAEVFENAIIRWKSEIFDNAKVFGRAHIGNGLYDNNLSYTDGVKVYGEAEVCGEAEVYGNTEIYEKANVSGSIVLKDAVEVYGDAKVSGLCKAEASGKIKICWLANVKPNGKSLGDRGCIFFYKVNIIHFRWLFWWLFTIPLINLFVDIWVDLFKNNIYLWSLSVVYILYFLKRLYSRNVDIF